MQKRLTQQSGDIRALVARVRALILDPATSRCEASRLLRRQGRRADQPERERVAALAVDFLGGLEAEQTS